jgi:hypothetical protein
LPGFKGIFSFGIEMVAPLALQELLEVLVYVFGSLKTHAPQEVLRITQLSWRVFHVKPWLVKQ